MEFTRPSSLRVGAIEGPGRKQRPRGFSGALRDFDEKLVDGHAAERQRGEMVMFPLPFPLHFMKAQFTRPSYGRPKLDPGIYPGFR